MNRRNILKAMPAALVVGAVPAFGAVSVEETPVMKAYREYVAYREWVNGPETANFTDTETDRAIEGLDVHLERIVSAPSAGPADTAIKLYAVIADYEALYGCPYRDALEAEARALVAA